MALKVQVEKLRLDLSLLKESTCLWVTAAVILTTILLPFLLAFLETTW